MSIRIRWCRRATSLTDIRAPITLSNEPIEAQFTTGDAVRLKKADLQHHLLRGRDLHRVDDAAVRIHALGERHCTIRSDRVRSGAAQHHLAIAVGDMDPRAPGAGPD